MKKVVITVVSFAVLFGTAAMPWSAISQEATPAASNSGFAIPACAFEEHSNAYDFTKAMTLHLNNGSGHFRAPLHLPHGSTIRKIVLVCKDNSAGNDISLILYRTKRTTASITPLATVYSSGSDSAWRNFSSASVWKRTVNNKMYAYFLKVYLPGPDPDFYLAQAHVFYDAP